MPHSHKKDPTHHQLPPQKRARSWEIKCHNSGKTYPSVEKITALPEIIGAPLVIILDLDFTVLFQDQNNNIIYLRNHIITFLSYLNQLKTQKNVYIGIWSDSNLDRIEGVHKILTSLINQNRDHLNFQFDFLLSNQDVQQRHPKKKVTEQVLQNISRQLPLSQTGNPIALDSTRFFLYDDIKENTNIKQILVPKFKPSDKTDTTLLRITAHIETIFKTLHNNVGT